MGVDECVRYACSATGKDCAVTDKGVRALLHFDGDNDGLLGVEDLIRYYRHKLQVAVFNSA